MLVLYKIRDFPPKRAHRRKRIAQHRQMVLAPQLPTVAVIQRLAFSEYHHTRPKMNYGIY